MRRVHQLIGVLFLLLALFLGFTASKLGYYSRLGPGAGFFPIWLALLLGILSITVLVQATMAAAEPLPSDFFPDRVACLRNAAVVGGLLAVAMVMRSLGFRWTMLAFYLGLLPLLGRRNPWEIAVLALLGSFGVHYVFAGLLGLSLPVGWLDI